MNNHAIKSTQGDLNYILAKHLLENINFEESELEYLKKILEKHLKFGVVYDTELNSHDCDYEMKQKIFSKLQNKTLLDVFENFEKHSSQNSQGAIGAQQQTVDFSNQNSMEKNSFSFFKSRKFGGFANKLTDKAFDKSCSLNFNLMKSILGHINTANIEENNIISVPIYCISFSKNDEMIITGDNNGLIKLWSTRTGALIEIFKCHEKAINDLIQIKDYIISVSDDRGIGFWSIKKLKLLSNLFLDEAIIRVLTYEYKKKSGGTCDIIIFCSANGRIYIINFDEVEELFNESEAANNNELIDLSQIDINRLYLESKIIEKYSLKKIKNNMQQSCLMVGQEGLLVCSFNEGLLCVWDLNKILQNVVDQKRFLCNFEQYLVFLEYVHNQLIQICEFNNKCGSHFLTGSIDGTVLIWKIQHHGLEHFRSLENPSAIYNISTLITQKDVISGSIGFHNALSARNNFVYPIYSIFKISDSDKRTRCSVNAAAWTCRNNYVVVIISSKPRKKTGAYANKNAQNVNANANENSNMLVDNANASQDNNINNTASHQNRRNNNTNQASNNRNNNYANSDFQKRTSAILIYSLTENNLINRLDEENGFFFHDECYVLEPHPKLEEIILTVTNTNEVIIVDILKSEIIKKFNEENYFFSNIPYNMIAAEGKFSANGDSFVISTYLGSVSIYSVYSKNSYSTTYMNQFFDDEFRNLKDELNAVFPQYVNMYNLPYVTQQPYSLYKLQTIKENKRLVSNYSMTAKEIERKVFNNVNYSENAFAERQEDCEKEEKAFIQAAKDNITYMINDQAEQSDLESLVSEYGSEIYYRRATTTNNRSNGSGINNNNNNNNNINNSNAINSSGRQANNQNASNNNLNGNLNEIIATNNNGNINHDNIIKQNEMIDYEMSSSYEEELDDLEDEEISIDSGDYGVVKNLRSTKFLGETARRSNNRQSVTESSARATRWNLRSRDQKKQDIDFINDGESNISEEFKSNFNNKNNNSREANKYSSSLRTRNNQPKYNYDDFLNSNKKENSNSRMRKRLKKRKGEKLGFDEIDNLPKVRTRLGLRSKSDNANGSLNNLAKKNVIVDDEEEEKENNFNENYENDFEEESEEVYISKGTRGRKRNSNNLSKNNINENHINGRANFASRNNINANNSRGNSGYLLRRAANNAKNQANIIDDFDLQADLENENNNSYSNENKILVERINSKRNFKRRKLDENSNKADELNEIRINNSLNTNILGLSTKHLNLNSNIKNINIGLSSLSNYEKRKQLSSENFISSFRDLGYNPFEFLNNLGDADFSNFIRNLIKSCESKIELCAFCGNKGKNVIGPFYKNETPNKNKNSFVYSLSNSYFNSKSTNRKSIIDSENDLNSDKIVFIEEKSKALENKENQLYLHIDCLILFNDNLDLENKKLEIEKDENEIFTFANNPLHEKIISNTINATISQNKACFRCGSRNATIKCPEANCNKYFHGSVCLGKYSQIYNRAICCFDCIRNKFINEEKQKTLTTTANYSNSNKNLIIAAASESLLNFSDIDRDFFLRDKFSFYSYYPQKGQKVYFILQAYEDFLKKHYQYVLFELEDEKVFFWKDFENMNSQSSDKKFNPYYPFLCEVRNVEFIFNNNETISYLKKIHRGSYKDKIAILIKLKLEIVEINKTFEIIFKENFEPDFLISTFNFEVNNEFYEDLQKNFINENLHNCFLETIISEVNYKGRVIDITSKENNKNFFNSPYESIIIAFENIATNLIENQALSFWDINNTQSMTKKKDSIFDFKEIFSSLNTKIKEIMQKKNNICRFFINKVDEIKDGAANYYNTIAVPCYLNLVLERLESFYYINFESIIFDINLIKENTLKYNGEETPISDLADKLYNSLIEILEEVLQSFKIGTDFIQVLKSSKSSNQNTSLNKNNQIASRANSNRRLIRNKNSNSEAKECDLIVSINEKNSSDKREIDSNETKSENEYDSAKFSFGAISIAANNKNGNNGFIIEEEEKIQENLEVKPKGKRGRKKKIRPAEEILESNLIQKANNVISIENENVMNSIEISNSKNNEERDDESYENKTSNDRQEIKTNKRFNKNSSSYSRRSEKNNNNSITIPIDDLKNEDSGRAIRSRKTIKYTENENNLSLESSKSDKLKYKRRGRPRKNQSASFNKNDYSCEDFEEEYEQDNQEFSVNTRSLGRKRNRQIIKFELK